MSPDYIPTHIIPPLSLSSTLFSTYMYCTVRMAINDAFKKIKQKTRTQAHTFIRNQTGVGIDPSVDLGT